MKRLYHLYGVWIALSLLLGGAMPSSAVTRTVHSLADDGGLATLRTILAASVSGDTIAFSNGMTGTIVLTNGELQIGHDITISGPGMNALAISGNNSSRVFEILSGTTVTIGLLTITNGLDHGTNGCFGTTGPGQGGGILNSGALALWYCRVSGNTAQGGNSDCENGGSALGGGIVNYGTLELNYCIASGNLASGGVMTDYNLTYGSCGSAFGGAIMNFGILNVGSCTLSGNNATGGSFWPYNHNTLIHGGSGNGGAIANQGTVNLNCCTLALNSSHGGNSGLLHGGDAVGGAIWNSSTSTNRALSCTICSNSCSGGNSYGHFVGGGGIFIGTFTTAELDVENTIIATNSLWGGDQGDGWEVYGAATSQGFNLIYNISGSSGWVSTDLLGVDPKLGPLQDNGGYTPTMALLTNSPAIDQGYSGAYLVDQRGFGYTRPVDLPSYPNAAGGNGSDIGAYELQLFEYYNYRDIGLRLFDGINTNKIAAEWPAVSALRIAKNGTNYGIILVATNSSSASKFRIQTASGTKSLMKLP